MSTTYVAVTLLAAAMSAFSAALGVTPPGPIARALANYGVPRSWWPWFSVVKAAGAVGLVVGLFVPVIGIAAGIGLVLYYLGAVITVTRAHFVAHVPFPLVYLAPVVAALALHPAA